MLRWTQQERNTEDDEAVELENSTVLKNSTVLENSDRKVLCYSTQMEWDCITV